MTLYFRGTCARVHVGLRLLSSFGVRFGQGVRDLLVLERVCWGWGHALRGGCGRENSIVLLFLPLVFLFSAGLNVSVLTWCGAWRPVPAIVSNSR